MARSDRKGKGKAPAHRSRHSHSSSTDAQRALTLKYQKQKRRAEKTRLRLDHDDHSDDPFADCESIEQSDEEATDTDYTSPTSGDEDDPRDAATLNPDDRSEEAWERLRKQNEELSALLTQLRAANEREAQLAVGATPGASSSGSNDRDRDRDLSRNRSHAGNRVSHPSVEPEAPVARGQPALDPRPVCVPQRKASAPKEKTKYKMRNIRKKAGLKHDNARWKEINGIIRDLMARVGLDYANSWSHQDKARLGILYDMVLERVPEFANFENGWGIEWLVQRKFNNRLYNMRKSKWQEEVLNAPPRPCRSHSSSSSEGSPALPLNPRRHPHPNPHPPRSDSRSNHPEPPNSPPRPASRVPSVPPPSSHPRPRPRPNLRPPPPPDSQSNHPEPPPSPPQLPSQSSLVLPPPPAPLGPSLLDYRSSVVPQPDPAFPQHPSSPPPHLPQLGPGPNPGLPWHSHEEPPAPTGPSSPFNRRIPHRPRNEVAPGPSDNSESTRVTRYSLRSLESATTQATAQTSKLAETIVPDTRNKKRKAGQPPVKGKQKRARKSNPGPPPEDTDSGGRPSTDEDERI